jgi:RNA-splicing ligase RtcB
MSFNKPTKIIENLLLNISQINEYKSHITLPDLHYKPQMEAPSSTAISTGDYIIPSLASAAINDGMSVIKLPFKKFELRDDIVLEFFSEINFHAAKTKFDINKYSLTIDELYDVCLNGAKAVINKYNLPNDILDSLELNGVMNIDLISEDIDRLVPKALLKSRFSRAEFGLNFKGNHFLELQSVNKIIEKEYMKKYDIQKNDLIVMTHLGPGPFTGNLMRIYTNREKIGHLHRVLYLFAKSYFHLFERKRSDLKYKDIVKYFFKPDKYQAYDINTRLGKDFYKLIQIGSNYGYAYQLGTFTAVRDAVRVIQKKYNLSGGEAKLIWNVSHNSINREKFNGREQIVTRHNSVKIYDQKPSIIAGSFDVPSCIGICFEPNANRLMNSHDHGIGAIIERLKNEKNIIYTSDYSKRYYFKRGTNKILDIKKARISQLNVLEEVVNYYIKQNVIRPWFFVKPVATLKN